MAIRGKKPRDPNANQTGVNVWTEVPDRPYTGPKPPLPREFGRWTRDWWKAVSSMPHCVLWRPGDWQFALDTARLHDRWASGSHDASISALTRRELLLGMTFDSRKALRIRYVNPAAFERPQVEPEETPAVADFAAERRRRLLDGTE